MSEKYYVVGDWHNEDEKCPINEASLTGSEWAEELAKEYDSCARMNYDLPGGVTYINEDQAQEVWNNIIERLKQTTYYKDNPETHSYNEQMLDLAKEVQRELDW